MSVFPPIFNDLIYKLDVMPNCKVSHNTFRYLRVLTDVKPVSSPWFAEYLLRRYSGPSLHVREKSYGMGFRYRS
ncbi:MAG: hypothetical protein HOE54_04525 [Gammaproteobacteria bacterium]|nr:hypothetical protein [Gammaproteobacteria bacterium]